ncbi:DUF4231 domain-containing protein [Streptomyces mirabilis]
MPSGGLTDSQLPALFLTADSASISGQRNYIRGTRWRLILSIVAAVFATLSFRLGNSPDLAAATVALAFLITVFIEIWMLTEKPEKTWYDGRALAESTKTLSWRYAVAADPFPTNLVGQDADRQFNDELRTLLREAPSTEIVPVTSSTVTESMTRLRNSALAQRKEIYLKDRIENQLKWYGGKAQFNMKLARRWRIILITIEGLGVTAAMLRVIDTIDFDLPGILAALLGAGAAWFAVRQYESLGRAYTFAASDLSTIYARLQLVSNEADWAQEAADAEEAISREHTMWRASRGAL